MRSRLTSKTVVVSLLVLIVCLVFGYLVVGESRTQAEKSVDESESILRGLRELIEQDAPVSEVVSYVNANIAKVPVDQATRMVLLLEVAQKEYLPELEKRYYSEDIQREFVTGYVSGIEPNDLHLVSDAKLEKLLTETKASGFRVETAEGMFWPVIDYELYKKYSLLVAEDIAAYIDIMAEESNRAPAKDAALVIGWNEITRRVLALEEFIRKYPGSEKLPEMKALYNRYVTLAFYGVNNTPLFDYSSHLLDEDARIVFAQVVKANPDSDFAKSLGDFLTVAEKNAFKLTEDVKAQREVWVEKLTK